MFLINNRKVLLSFLLLLIFSFIYSQELIPFEHKKQLTNNKINALRLAADSATFRQTAFLNGKMHTPVINQYSHPYLAENRWLKGSLEYRGETFQARLLKYDIETDHLIVLPYRTNNAYPIALKKDYINSFNLSNRNFLYYKDIDLPVGSIADGYLEVIYDDKTKFFLKWQKKEVLNNSLRQIEYQQRLTMLLWKDDKYYRIRSRIGLLYHLRDKRKEVRQFIREHQLMINGDNYSSIKKVLEYYDNL